MISIALLVLDREIKTICNTRVRLSEFCNTSFFVLKYRFVVISCLALYAFYNLFY